MISNIGFSMDLNVTLNMTTNVGLDMTRNVSLATSPWKINLSVFVAW